MFARSRRMFRGGAILAAAAISTASSANSAGDQVPTGRPVTVDNFCRAESDHYFGKYVRDGGFGGFFHLREPTPIDRQSVIRTNRDTLYSKAVFDLEAGPVTITLPEAGRRFMSLQVINQDHYCPAVYYGAGKRTLSRNEIGTRYAATLVRTLVDPNDPADLAEVRRLQDAIRVEQADSGRFEAPAWDPASQKQVRDALLVLGATIPDTRRMFGRKQDVDPVRHLVGSALAWGGCPEKDAVYLNFTPRENDGRTAYRLTVGKVPVDGFWSISVYNAQGYFEANPENAYSLNNLTAKPNADGSITIRFGGEEAANRLPIVAGWNYLVRLFRPRSEILDGSWKFPEAELVK
jgi:hypothetical protein